MPATWKQEPNSRTNDPNAQAGVRVICALVLRWFWVSSFGFQVFASVTKSLRPMRVAMVEFLLRRVAHVDNLHVELERLTGQRVVGVDGDGVRAHCNDGDHARAVVGLGLKLSADGDLLDAG